jgi:hypothetical protein
MIDSYLSDRIRHESTGILLRNISPANLEKKVSAITACSVVFDEGLKIDLEYIFIIAYDVYKKFTMRKGLDNENHELEC